MVQVLVNGTTTDSFEEWLEDFHVNGAGNQCSECCGGPTTKNAAGQWDGLCNECRREVFHQV